MRGSCLLRRKRRPLKLSSDVQELCIRVQVRGSRLHADQALPHTDRPCRACTVNNNKQIARVILRHHQSFSSHAIVSLTSRIIAREHLYDNSILSQAYTNPSSQNHHLGRSLEGASLLRLSATMAGTADMSTYAGRLATFDGPVQIVKRRASTTKKSKTPNTVEWPHQTPAPEQVRCTEE